MEKFYLRMLYQKKERLKSIRSIMQECISKGESLPISAMTSQIELIDNAMRDDELLPPEEVEFYQQQHIYAQRLKSEFASLTKTEITVCQCMLDELSNKEIALCISKSEKSVERYISSLGKKLPVASNQRGEVRRFLKRFLLHGEEINANDKMRDK